MAVLDDVEGYLKKRGFDISIKQKGYLLASKSRGPYTIVVILGRVPPWHPSNPNQWSVAVKKYHKTSRRGEQVIRTVREAQGYAKKEVLKMVRGFLSAM